jgi:acetyl-CoA acyltransferase
MKEVVVVDAVRTPMGRSKGGMFRASAPTTSRRRSSAPSCAATPRSIPAEIDDIVWGCVQQTLEQAFNVARFAQLSRPSRRR